MKVTKGTPVSKVTLKAVVPEPVMFTQVDSGDVYCYLCDDSIAPTYDQYFNVKGEVICDTCHENASKLLDLLGIPNGTD